ncbi:hypothetical protein IQ268_16675, partial [Oculatella sp. LEGE 06141]|uniref:hypothetical protein n=1 Tax=Oculatella sp. LEGE 06141 TaxID=1828648 RepID=UPI0019F22BD5
PTPTPSPTAPSSNSGSSSNPSWSTARQTNDVWAKVVSISRDGDVRVRLPNGRYQRLPHVNSSVLSRLRPGDEVVLTTINRTIIDVAFATNDTQQAWVETEPNRVVEVQEQTIEEMQTVEETQTVEERWTTPSEPTAQQQVVPPPVMQPWTTPPQQIVPIITTPISTPRALW